MCPVASPATCLMFILRRTLSVKFLFLIIGVSFVLSIVWIEGITRFERFHGENLAKEALKNVAKDFRYVEVYRSPQKLSENLKYILLWTPDNYSPFYFLGNGQRAFLQNNCPVTNCYVTADRNFFGDDITKFHAIAFNGRNLKYMAYWWLPKKRSIHQKFIYFNMESADNYPICNKIFDDFFNWTATYKLSSDIPYPYIVIRNKNGDIIGPSKNINWEKNDFENEVQPFKVQNKTKAVAWFVSSCSSRSGRTEFVQKLQRALLPYGYTIDIYGSCGTLQCPIERKSECNNILEKDYYFYLSLENTLTEDYVTEKLLTALQHDVVPIVYGGADYSRFLPPDSYLDGRQLTAQDLAATMAILIKSPKIYRQYFKWKQHYSYSDPSAIENVCAVCAALNNDTLRLATSRYKEFRKWWNPNYTKQCQGILGSIMNV